MSKVIECERRWAEVVRDGLSSTSRMSGHPAKARQSTGSSDLFIFSKLKKKQLMVKVSFLCCKKKKIEMYKEEKTGLEDPAH